MKHPSCGLLGKETETMKELYQTPEMEIVEFNAEDVITTSGDENETPIL